MTSVRSVRGEPLFAAAILVAAIAGPEAVPPEAFEPPNIERILTLA